MGTHFVAPKRAPRLVRRLEHMLEQLSRITNWQPKSVGIHAGSLLTFDIHGPQRPKQGFTRQPAAPRPENLSGRRGKHGCFARRLQSMI